MRRRTFLSAVAAAPLSPRAWRRQPYPYRWVYVSRSLRDDRDVADVRDIVRTAFEHGLNGMLFAAGLDRLDLQPPDYFRRLQQVKEICDEYGIEIIPSIFFAGYGGSILGHNRNLAEGIPVSDALFVARNGEARLAPDPPVAFVNGGLEEYEGHRAKSHRLQDRPGDATFIDTTVTHSGSASLRFENFGGEPGPVRLAQEIAVHPHRCYCLTAWVKTDRLEPGGSFRLNIMGADGRSLAPWEPELPSTADWRRLVLGFNSRDNATVRIYAGVSNGKCGRCWVDDFSIQEAGLVNVLRRPGTPITVHSEAKGAVYEEGRDYAPIADPQLNFRFDHDGPPIRILPGSRIAEGERLRVSYYHGMPVNRGQVTVCMSEPEVYDIWRQQARLLHDALRPKAYVLSMDEVRAGGSCQACQRRQVTMAQILGNCISRQVEILRDVNPEAVISVWSDMLDPHHNARGNYYLVEGDYTGSWNYIPKDLIIVCWYYQKRRESLAHFSSLGFRTLAGAYYDADSLENPSGWLEALEATPNACGIMYTTWQNKYRLLAPFGDLVTSRASSQPAGSTRR